MDKKEILLEAAELLAEYNLLVLGNSPNYSDQLALINSSKALTLVLGCIEHTSDTALDIAADYCYDASHKHGNEKINGAIRAINKLRP